VILVVFKFGDIGIAPRVHLSLIAALLVIVVLLRLIVLLIFPVNPLCGSWLIVLLIFRYCVYLKDKRDYLAWAAEVEKTKMEIMTTVGTSPIYKAVNTKYENPMYRAKQS